ncbi:MAG: outer membrane beta-barrel protein [Bacteroidaceae bacterium]|nr:outer membrane beta-barrel protein [Bacteroidaceae bacterium]
MKQFIMTLCLALWGISAWAQKWEVSGCLIATDSKEPLAMVSVQLLSSDSVRIATTNTNEVGEFTLKATCAGEYIVMARIIGFEVMTRNIHLTSEKPVLKLGTIHLQPISTELDEVSISALARLMTMKEDTLLFNTAALRLPANASLAALMKQLPGISIDRDGNLTYMGKVVNKILVDGKPFFGDVNTALVNMPTDAVKNVKIYEKVDEDKEFRQELDTEKATVVDLSIKEEYKSEWMANVNLGGGTDKRYIGKVFGTNFTDHRRIATYVQMNNISQNQRVDENGNWQHWSGTGGIYTYRKAGAIMQWDNGKSNSESGSLGANGNVDVSHNNILAISDNHRETFLGNSNSQYSYAHYETNQRDLAVEAKAKMYYNINVNNRLSLGSSYSYQDQRAKRVGSSSTYGEKPEQRDNLAESLVGDNISDELTQRGIYSQSGNELTNRYAHRARFDASYTHLFKKEGRFLETSLNSELRDNILANQSRELYRYFLSNAPHSDLLSNKYGEDNVLYYWLVGSVRYAEPITKHLKLNADYSFTHTNEEQNHNLFDGFDIPLGMRPTEGDSLDFVRDITNSYFSKSYTNQHRVVSRLQGTWDKVEVAVSPSLNLFSDYLHYNRDGVSYNPSRTHFGFAVFSFGRYKFTPQNYIQFNYMGSTSRPSLLELIPIRDTSDPMLEIVNNPNLKGGWSNNVTMNTRFFNRQRGDSYNISAGFNNSSNAIVTYEQTDPVSGYRKQGKMNVDGNYNMYASLSTEQPLDTARHWILSASASLNFSHQTSYVGTLGNDLGLSSVDKYRPYANIAIRWRNDIWSVVLKGEYECNLSRYRVAQAYNENAHTLDISINPQVDLPFGMKINTSFSYYARSGYADPMFNQDQCIWNASVSQTFLKNKALTLQLEGVDLLRQRTAEMSSANATSRTYTRTRAYLSYVMLHAVYKFKL